MKIFELFRRPKRNTAQLAKERLQIIVSHESARRTGPDVIRKMQQEILEVICRYVHIDQDKIKVQLERHGDQSVLELNVTLPDGKLMQLNTPTEAENTSENIAEKSAVSASETADTKSNASSKNQKNKKKQAPKNTEQAEA
jgi:cell division topological specificity factor